MAIEKQATHGFVGMNCYGSRALTVANGAELAIYCEGGFCEQSHLLRLAINVLA